MTFKEIYTWVINNDPNEPDVNEVIWRNMASYCYYMNSIHSLMIPHDVMREIYRIANDNDITIPDSKHTNMTKLSNTSNIDEIVSNLKTLHLQE